MKGRTQENSVFKLEKTTGGLVNNMTLHIKNFLHMTRNISGSDDFAQEVSLHLSVHYKLEV